MTRPYTTTVPACLLDEKRKPEYLGFAARYLERCGGGQLGIDSLQAKYDVYQESIKRIIYALSPDGTKAREARFDREGRPQHDDFYAKPHGDDEWIPWFYKVMTNVVREICRKHKRQVSDSGGEGSLLEFVAAVSDNMDSICIRELAAHIDACAKKLPDKLRFVFERRYYEDDTHEQLADSCQLAISTIFARIQEARLAVMKCLKSRGYENAH